MVYGRSGGWLLNGINMARDKFIRYQQVKRLENVRDLGHLRPGTMANERGNWGRQVFGNENPIILELACGKGEYAIALAKKYPDKNFIGIDIKGERIWKGAGRALDENLPNVFFLRSRIDFLDQIFSENEISGIWITFPDPYLKSSKESKRLTSSKFLNLYKNILKPGAHVNLKTDSDELYAFTQKSVQEYGATVQEQIDDVYSLPEVPELLQIRTYYETKHLQKGLTIHFISFTLTQDS